MRAPKVQEDIDTFITEVSDFINVENLKVFTRLGESDQTFGMQIPAVEQIEVLQFWKVGQEFCEVESWTVK